MIGAFGFGIIFVLLFSEIAAQDECSKCRCCLEEICDSNSTCRLGCKDGYWGNQCTYKCTHQCKSCERDNRDKCIVCAAGYYKSDDNLNGCSSCGRLGCICSYDYGCDGCLEGYYNHNTACFYCPTNCKTCTNTLSCSSCYQGYYGPICQFECGTFCKNGVCESEKSICNCSMDFLGINCSDCSLGKYGPQCQYTCSEGCVNGVCDGSSGICSCKTGWSGSKCNICAPDYYGTTCSLLCRPECMVCNGYNDCKSCVRGHFGPLCQNTCGKGCLNNECDKSNGRCTCKSTRFNDSYCDSCIPGNFGQGCDQDCQDSCYSCSKSMKCTSCNPGFFGDMCEQNCSESCPQGQSKDGSQSGIGESVAVITVIAIVVFVVFRKQ